MQKVIRAVSLDIEPRAECLDPECEWKRAPSRHTLADTRNHVRDRGHEVAFIRERRDLYRREP